MRNSDGIRYEYGYTTSDEIAFITGLATGCATRGRVQCDSGWAGKGANRDAFLAYARLVLDGMRTYDPVVNVGAVRLCIAELMRERPGQAWIA